MNVNDVCKLMGCMAKNKIAMLEYEGLKLTLTPERPAPQVAASNIKVSDAMQAVHNARVQAARIAEQRISVAQTRTARAREKAVGGITDGTLKAVEEIYKEAVATPIPVAPRPVEEVSELSPEVP